MLAAPVELEFHSRVLRLNVFIALHQMHFSLHLHRGSQDFPGGAQGEARFSLHLAFLRHSGSPHTDLDKWLTAGFVDLSKEASPKLPKKMSAQEWPRDCHLGLACSLLQFACPELQFLLLPNSLFLLLLILSLSVYLGHIPWGQKWDPKETTCKGGLSPSVLKASVSRLHFRFGESPLEF